MIRYPKGHPMNPHVGPPPVAVKHSPVGEVVSDTARERLLDCLPSIIRVHGINPDSAFVADLRSILTTSPEPPSVEEIAEAWDDAQPGYSIQLTRLVDGVSTYELDYGKGEVLTFSSHADAFAHTKARRAERFAQAIHSRITDGAPNTLQKMQIDPALSPDPKEPNHGPR